MEFNSRGRSTHLSLDSLRLLDAIDRRGSFAAAATERFVVTSSITHSVRKLEQALGLVLFDRTGRRARFTREGREVLERGRLLLRQAADFDDEVRRIATGWEPRLVLSVDQVLRIEPLVPLLSAFFAAAPGTTLDLRREAASGSWDALLSGRADLVVGAPSPGPPGGGYETAPFVAMRFVLVVAPSHPLARVDGPVGDDELARHRAVVVGDTARTLPALHYGLLDNALRLRVPDAESKLQALLAGLGCGFLLERAARPHLRAGRLRRLQVAAPAPPGVSVIAWRAGENGRALRWWIDRLRRRGTAGRLSF